MKDGHKNDIVPAEQIAGRKVQKPRSWRVVLRGVRVGSDMGNVG